MIKVISFLLLTLFLGSISFAQITTPMVSGTMISWDIDGASGCSTPFYYRIDVGSSLGYSDFGSTGLVLASSGTFGTGPSYSTDLASTSGITLPTDGSTANVRLWHFSSCGWRFANLTIDTTLVPPPVVLPS